ncbi:hypothetical protein HII17_06395 [Thalassotalea sp. M1531]|uniref:Uncharacterized protein n=1 Tax=Thalassotalea algicola TaxID=2716224 RepID=A0A7Y0Q5N8_9GAMM|nr:hypothetical protein [Thalassotalea algicola]NMP31189.1 hypothetical protein [Thalassotalea algicola]
MEYSTAKAIRQIKLHNDKKVSINGKHSCPLQAMAFAFQYHTLDINESTTEMKVTGRDKVKVNEAFLIK